MAKNSNQKKHGNSAKINGTVNPKYGSNAITQNKMGRNGEVFNVSDQNAVLAKQEVDANQK